MWCLAIPDNSTELGVAGNHSALLDARSGGLGIEAQLVAQIQRRKGVR